MGMATNPECVARLRRTATDKGFLLVLVCAPPLVRRESPLRKEFMIDDQARRRYYASRFSLFVSYGRVAPATMPGPACASSLIRMRGPVYGKPQATSWLKSWSSCGHTSSTRNSWTWSWASLE